VLELEPLTVTATCSIETRSHIPEERSPPLHLYGKFKIQNSLAVILVDTRKYN
jgi:hypothetical protein